MSCDIIIPVWNQLKLTKECLESIANKTKYPYRLIIIDNASDDKTREYLESVKAKFNTHLIRNEDNLGFVKAVNQGLRVSTAKYICVMNNDTIAAEEWLSEMVSIAESAKEIGLVNPSSNNLGQHMKGGSLDDYAAGLRIYKGQYIEMGSCIGFCMLIKREVFDKIGYLDDVYHEGNFDDTDYSRKAENAGYLCVRAKGAYVYHHIKSSFLKKKDYEEIFAKNRDIYNKRWGRPKRLLFIVTKRHGKLFGWMKNEAVKNARNGNWIWLFFAHNNREDKDGALQIPEHSNIKLINLPNLFFETNCLVRILAKKKRFDAIFVDDSYLIYKINRYKRFHNAETILMGG